MVITIRLNVFCLLFALVLLLCFPCHSETPEAEADEDRVENDCEDEDCVMHEKLKYTKEHRWSHYLEEIESALAKYEPCSQANCSCHKSVIEADLSLWVEDGVRRDMLDQLKDRGTTYQIIEHKLYREEKCMFPFRCKGVEHFILEIIDDLPNMEFILNTHDYPQTIRRLKPGPVFSFSKTGVHADVMYPAWSFWEGGPAISLYPTGIGRWDLHRDTIAKEAAKWPWEKKKPLGFFRGSRTTGERDALVLHSRSHPDAVDAQYTKNQAWRSLKDTLGVEPASEVKFEDHCHYKYLYNFRGVAASFRLKHLFLCKSLVFHVGEEWKEFFYPALKPWVHYIPIATDFGNAWELLDFVKENDEVVRQIAERGHEFVWHHLRMEDVTCYWKTLLLEYAKLLKFRTRRNPSFAEVKR
ncbi:PREDICTED: protein O-glucosyltransferase 1-like [Priapulus caudatus]|uniref:Protein O-glucosyltransferase 1-like n=1 Tax=Priapulus caudatus TaxID=37621 RepID=A0ABM1E606_PRICU|nr:PREDICTED: protein O-glucosyltransferase 1-like [Priapulus caudatus]